MAYLLSRFAALFKSKNEHVQYNPSINEHFLQFFTIDTKKLTANLLPRLIKLTQHLNHF